MPNAGDVPIFVGPEWKPGSVVGKLVATLQFTGTTGDIFAALRVAGKLPAVGSALVMLDGWGGGGGGAGGGISGGAAPAVGGAGGGGATRKSAQVVIDLSHTFDANIALGGNGGTGANPTGANGNQGGETLFVDSTSGTILVAFEGAQGGVANFANTQNHALTTAVRGVPGAADGALAPDLPANTTIAPALGRASPATAPACGGYAQALAADTFAGSGLPNSALNSAFGGGNGGQNAVGAGTLSFAGGGGGGGPAGAGGKGGDSVGPGLNGNNGISGGAVNPNSGAGGGGGSAASSNLNAGGQGGSGGRGFLTVSVFVIPP
jgi:hypothetical protein